MVDTPKENNDEERKDAAKDSSLGKQPKRQRRRRTKSRLGKNSDNIAGKNNTPVDSKGNDDHTDPAIEQDEPGTANIVQSRYPITATPRIKLINLSPERKTVRTTMHT